MKSIGVKVIVPFAVSKALSEFKRNSLFFDSFAIPNYRHLLSHHLRTEDESFMRAEIEFLNERGLIFQPQVKDDFVENFESRISKDSLNLLVALAKYKESIKEIRRLQLAFQFQRIEILSSYDKNGTFPVSLDRKEQREVKESIRIKKILERRGIYQPLKRINHGDESSYDEANDVWFDIMTRMKSFEIELVEEKEVFPLISNSIIFSERENAEKKAEIIQITLNTLPLPDETTSWEQIFEFRSDSDSKSKLLALRNWINETARGELKKNELKEKFEYLLNQYERHMALHKMKYQTGILETIVTTTAEVVEDLVKLKFGKIAQLPFSIKNKRIALMEEEMKAPGKELAYISKAKETFS